MEQKDENTQGQKPKICKLAILSPLVVLFGYWTGVVLRNQIHLSFLPGLGMFIFLVSPVAGLVLGIIAERKIHKSKGALKGYVFSSIGLVLAASMLVIMPVAFIVCPPHQNMENLTKISCSCRLAGLGKAIRVYSDHYEKYPTKDMWCDLLVEHADVDKLCYVCIGASENVEGLCYYAINPNCGPNSPPDTVLLFETKGGWNQYGGPEILTIEHHANEGCNILFNNGDVNFIETEHLGELKWGNKPKDEQKR